MVFVLLVPVALALTWAVFLAAAPGRAPTAEPPPTRTDEMTCRVVFVQPDPVYDEMHLDCVVVESAHLPPATPFALIVESFANEWFGAAALGLIERWADEDRIVRIGIVDAGDGERVDASDDRSRVRLAVIERVGA